MPNYIDNGIKLCAASADVTALSCVGTVSIESETSTSSEGSVHDVPDFMNCSFETLHQYASSSNHDSFIFDD